jgi:hypothetical protein
MMLNERPATGFFYTPDADLATVSVESGDLGTGEISARLLIDSKGFLVGIDCRDKAGRGVIVMLGPHEAVAETRDARVTLGTGGIEIGDARKSVRAGERNPYMR